MNDFYRLWEELSNLEKEEFIDKSDYEDFREYMLNEDGLLLEMANLRGNDIKLHPSIPFSLFISSKQAVRGAHAIRVKVLWNPNKMTATPDGELQLHGTYEYKSYSHKYKPTNSEILSLKNYCKKYKVLFAAIWESILDSTDFIHYQEGLISFKELLTKFDLKGKSYYLINHCSNVEELENCVRDNKIFNLWD